MDEDLIICVVAIVVANVIAFILDMIFELPVKRYKAGMKAKHYDGIYMTAAYAVDPWGGYFGEREYENVGGGAQARGGGGDDDSGYSDPRHVIWDTASGYAKDQFGNTYDLSGNPHSNDNPYGHL